MSQKPSSSSSTSSSSSSSSSSSGSPSPSSDGDEDSNTGKIVIDPTFIHQTIRIGVSKSSKRIKINEDRITTLPQPILHHILSFLDMKSVVQTSILSKTWRSIWSFVPFLNFDVQYHKKGKINFMDFVNEVLLFRESSNIHTFRFKCGDSTAYDCLHPISDWIQLVARRKVEVLNLKIRPEMYKLELPHFLFTCKSLVNVKLKMLERGKVMDMKFCGLTVFYLPGLVNLPNLRTLHLNSLLVGGTEFIQKLFKGCPVLETLIMIDCGLPEVDNIIISATQLKHLEIDGFSRYTKQGSEEKCKITISAPNLISLVCKADISNECTLEHLSSLVKADIDMRMSNVYDDDVKDLEVSSSWKEQVDIGTIKILEGVSHAESLCLSAMLLEVLPDPTGVLPTPFYNLRQLKLTIWLSRNCIRGIKYLLENSFSLETLLLEITADYCSKRVTYPYCNEIKGDPEKVWEYWGTDLGLVGNFYHLKFVEIWNIRGSVNELEFLKLLLVRGIALKKLVIFTCGGYSPDGRRQLKKFSEKLLAFPRASSSLAILFF